MERLKDAGIPVDRGIPKCTNCKGKNSGVRTDFGSTSKHSRLTELGHIAKSCKEEKVEIDHPHVQCVNCEELGHRARDCTQPRKDRFACRNCKCVERSFLYTYAEGRLIHDRQSGHSAAECIEPRSAEGIECKKCNESRLLHYLVQQMSH